MFGLSFTALFLEMMVIRWVPSVVSLIAFYANLMLLSSFLGLGAGALAARRPNWRLFEWFPVFLALDIATLLWCRRVVFSTSDMEMRLSALSPTVYNHLVLIAVFAVNALVFVPIGQRMGRLFEEMPRLRAYGWDLAGSLVGTLAFAAFSLLYFSPVVGLAGVMAIYLTLSSRRRWVLDVALFAGILVAVFTSGERAAIWSPYHYVTVSRMETPKVVESAPPADLLTMRDPPIYSVSINQVYYHFNASIDPGRYTPNTPLATQLNALSQYYRFPYALAKGRGRALVLGAGGGGDVLGALAAGMRTVDAVEIDPAVVQISRRFNAGAPYADPRVRIHIDDARSFLARTTRGYDVIMFGLLDSHVLSSSMNNVRLDGYVYTVEGIRQAFELLDDDGLLALAFYVEKDWLLPKLHQLVRQATGREPTMYVLNRTIALCVSKDPSFRPPANVFQLQRTVLTEESAEVDVPTDDWPFLYLMKRAVPPDYLIAIGSLLALSLLVLVGLRRAAFGTDDVHFALLGMAFLLLETKSITDCALYFGATWLVTVIVVSGILLMVMAANLWAERLARFSFWMYLPLFLALALLLLVPREQVLAWSWMGRLAWALLVVPLPIFFAGIIFSTTFRHASMPSAAFGANLIGAMIGGFCEYLGMAIGNHRLSLLVVGAYLLSLLTLAAARRARGGAAG
jgi:hypothetical protein